MLKVVLAYDGSVQANKAVDHLSWWPTDNLTVLVVTVLQGPALNEVGDAVEFDPEEYAQAESKHKELSKVLGTKEIAHSCLILNGDPREAIIDIAGKEGATLILIGSRGLNVAQRMFLGSVSFGILEKADCPVMVVR
jgi:nucleotide-binding universal stress UspA family protein